MMCALWFVLGMVVGVAALMVLALIMPPIRG